MGPDTTAAIRTYQAQRGLPVDGVPSRQLLDRLEAEVFSKRTPAEPTALLPASPGLAASVACAGTGADSVACAEAVRQLTPAPAESGADAVGIARDGGLGPIPQ
jgi:peptidoglycan hydrolase-like protein with peptidoglycan-binding domain